MTHVSMEVMFSLADGDMLAEDRQRIMQHISSCEKCKKQMSRALSFNEELRRFWDEYLSLKCPEDDMLFNYMEGALDHDEHEEVKQHLSDCPICRYKFESAEESLEEIERLERASEVLPSLINRLKRRLNKLDVRELLDGMEKTFGPTRLAEEFFAHLAKSVRVLSYPLTAPLEAPALLPMAAGGMKLADTGRGFRSQIVTEEGVPYEIELVQFGDRFILNLKAVDKAHGEALVRYSLLEDDEMRGQGVVLVSDGKGAIKFSEEELEALRPEENPLQLKLEVLLKGDTLSTIGAEDLVGLLERLPELMESESPEVVDAAIEAVGKIEELLPEKH